jgi:hypothetical protein
MPEFADRSTDIGIAQSTVPAAAAAQISAAFLDNVDMISSVFNWVAGSNITYQRLMALHQRAIYRVAIAPLVSTRAPAYPLSPDTPNTPELP